MCWFAGVLGLLFATAAVQGQQQVRHYFYGSNAVPGELAFQAMLANPQWQAKIQPAKIIVPEGCLVSAWNENAFAESAYANPVVGLSIGPVYRFRITNIPQAEASAIYPSVELFSQLTPPQGLETRFPIPIVFSEADLKAAADGRMVVKVVYLENPDTALPYRQIINDQPFIEIGESEDALRTAERLGRPIAIIRLGSRIPTVDELNSAYAFSGIPLTVFPEDYARKLAARELTADQVSFAKPTLSESPRQGCSTGCSGSCCNPNDQWRGFATQPPLWSNNACEATNRTEAPNKDEYLCDGADRMGKVKMRDDGSIVGLDMEDTIGHFQTKDGKKMVAESNRICIYSPRFAAIRKVSKASVSTETARLVTYRDKVQLNLTKSKEFSGTTMQQVQAQGHQVASRAGTFLDQTRGVLADGILVPSGFNAGFEAYENLALVRLGKHRSSENARLSLGMQSANVWSDPVGLAIAEKNIQPVITRDPLRVQELTSVKTENNSQLRLCKVASKIAADPGEEVEFTIRFDNVGGNLIDKVTIIDNLTTRLEYVPDSTECSVDAKFSNERNEGDSLVLKWEITEPLEVGQGGLIRFRCRVR